MKKEDITPSTFPKYRPDHLTKSLPVFVKDPANYNTIQRQLLETLASRHSHSDMETWSKCIECQLKVKEHGALMRKFGFKNKETYYAWKKIMHVMLTGDRIKLR